jgi:hypothetical protein
MAGANGRSCGIAMDGAMNNGMLSCAPARHVNGSGDQMHHPKYAQH